MQTPPALPTKQPSDWWNRNWKWFVLVLVVAGVAGMVLITGAAVSVFALMKSSGAYSQAVARVKAASAVTNALGSPITDGLLFSGNINVSGASGRANLTIPVSGPKGSATIYVVARKEAGNWRFDQLVVQVGSSGARIDLSDK